MPDTECLGVRCEEREGGGVVPSGVVGKMAGEEAEESGKGCVLARFPTKEKRDGSEGQEGCAEEGREWEDEAACYRR